MAIQDDARSTTAEQTTTPGLPEEHRSLGQTVVSWVTTTDHKVVGYLDLITSFMFFCVAGVLAVLIRAELFAPGVQIVDCSERFIQLFTIQLSIMLLLFS